MKYVRNTWSPVQMGQVGDLIGAQGAAAAGVLGPAEHPGLEEGAIDDQLPAALEQVEQANLALGPLEFVRLLDGHPRHPPAFGGDSITLTRELLFLGQQIPASHKPFFTRNYFGVFHRPGGHLVDFSLDLNLGPIRLLRSYCETPSPQMPSVRRPKPRRQRLVPRLPNRKDTSFTSWGG